MDLRLIKALCLLYTVSGALTSVVRMSQNSANDAPLYSSRDVSRGVDDPVCDAVVPNYRFDCMPDGGTEDKCKQRGCCWSPMEGAEQEVGRKIDVPYCFFPSNVPSYKVTSYAVVRGGYSLTLTRDQKSPWPGDVMTLKLDITSETENRMRVKVYDPAHARYEVPLERAGGNSSAPRYGYISASVTHDPFSITLSAGQTTILDGSLVGAPLIFTDQFIQWSFRLGSPHLYGLGEHKERFLINATEGWRQRAFWARDVPPQFDTNLYGSHPFFMGLTSEDGGMFGGAYGVLLLNSNAMEVDLQPLPALTFRTTGGVLDMYVFYGTTPDAVVAEYSNLIGRPAMPPLWSLGYHQCRYGAESDKELTEIISRTRGVGMPYEVQWSDIDYMADHKDWTYDPDKYKGLPDIVKDLHDHDQKYVIIVDPGIKTEDGYAPYTTGLTMDVFIKNSSGQPLVGKVWPGETVFPDFTHPNASEWWFTHAKAFHDQVPFDGLWTDMNEPSNFVTGSTLGCTDDQWDKPPYTPGILGGDLADKTVCPSAQQHLSSHYNLHSMYGHFEVKVSHGVLEKLRNKRSFIISRSTFPSTGVYGGHWSGDVSSTWEDLYYSIPVMLDFQLFGVPLVGADICGFGGDTTEELCTRWMQLGAFYPFMRNHNSLGQRDQDPGVWSEAAQEAMKDVTELRYILIPLLYTLFYHAHANGTPVVRPLVFQYPHDAEAVGIDTQFMWGDALLISPVLTQSATTVQAYFSPNDTYYDLRSGEMMTSSGWVQLDAPLDTIPVHMRGGAIVPIQKPALTTTAQKSEPYGLIVALTNHTAPYNPGHVFPPPPIHVRGPTSSGALYQDDGDGIDSFESGAYNYVTFLANNCSLNSTVLHSGYHSDAGMTLDTIVLYGTIATPSLATVNGKPASISHHLHAVIINSFQADLTQPLKVTWQ